MRLAVKRVTFTDSIYIPKSCLQPNKSVASEPKMTGTTFERLVLGSVAVILLGLVLVAKGKPTPATNLTVIVDKNDPRLICERTTWYSVCWFLFSNYVLHALSVRSLPGEITYATTAYKLCCLLVPYTGLRRGLCLISRASNFGGNDLQCAARANALCMVTRTADWRPRDGDTIDGCQINIVDSAADHAPLSNTKPGILFRIRTWETMKSMKSAESSKSIEKVEGAAMKKLRRLDSTVAMNIWRYRNHLRIQIKDFYQRPPCQNIIEKFARVLIETYRFSTQNPTDAIVSQENFKVQGYCELAPGYALSYIPPDVKVYPKHNSQTIESASHPLYGTSGLRNSAETRIASAHNVPRVLFSIGQTISGGYALYKARGPQIERYGFAAFGLTVVPYLLISVVNFFGALFTSEYETIFLVHSSIMDEMIERGGRTDGVVGTIHPPRGESLGLSHDKREELVEIPSKSLVFEKQEDLLCCYDESQPSEPQVYQISPYERPVVGLKGKARRGFFTRLSRVWSHIKWPVSAPKASPQKLPTSTITIPSHPAFTRLCRSSYQVYIDLFCVGLLFLAVLMPYLIIWLLSGWKANHSTSTQRNLILNWLICGLIHGYFVGNVERLTGKSGALKGLLYTFLCYGSYSVGGFVIVAEEMVESGDCQAIS